LPLASRLPSCCRLDIQPPTRSSPHSLLLVSALEYSLEANAKTQEGTGHPDRDQQFQRLNERVSRHLKAREPAVSLDTKMKMVIGPYQNKSQEWRSKGEPEKVLVHGFIDPAVPKAIPSEVYDGGRGRILDGEAYNIAQPQTLIWTRMLFFIEEKFFFFFQVFYIRLHIQLEFFFISVGSFCMFTDI
jgi:hypothetical protein